MTETLTQPEIKFVKELVKQTKGHRIGVLSEKTARKIEARKEMIRN